jgi:hypothetical protein
LLSQIWRQDLKTAKTLGLFELLNTAKKLLVEELPKNVAYE